MFFSNYAMRKSADAASFVHDLHFCVVSSGFSH